MKLLSSLEDLYKRYPRKMGKKRGMEKLKKIIKTETDFEAFLLAIENYKRYLIREGVEAQYIKYFSTFVNEYEDWIDDEAGTVELEDKFSFLKEVADDSR